MIDYSPNADLSRLEAFYGLPQKVAYCKRCTISNQRPNSAVEYQHTRGSRKQTINFDEEGICDACRMAERKRTGIDWDARKAELKALCDRFRRNDGRYDCVIPGSGGKDSFYTSYVLKNEFGMHPLTVTWAPHLYTPWGWHNFLAWMHAGFDNHLITPNGRVHRLLTRLSVDRILHPFQPFFLGQKFIAPRLAAAFDIPLVFYGENEAEYGNPIEDNEKAQRDFQYFTSEDTENIFIGGVSVRELKDRYRLSSHDLQPYMPANPEELKRHKVEVHYLGYYMKWHPQSCYYFAVEHGGFQAAPERSAGSYSKYNSIDDKVDDLHFFTYHVKFGLGRATYDASQEIRSGDIERDEGVALVKRYDGEWPERFEKELMEYISIDEHSFGTLQKEFENPVVDKEIFLKHADTFRSPHLWMHDGEWKLRKPVWASD